MTVLGLLYLASIGAPAASPFFAAPAGNAFAKVVPGGTTILPNGRFLTPIGRRLYTHENCWNAIAHPNGRTVIAFSDDSILVYPNFLQPNPRAWLLRKPGIAPAGVLDSSGRNLIVSNGEEGGIDVLDISAQLEPAPAGEGRFQAAPWQSKATLTANFQGATAAFINDIALDATGRYAYGVDIAHQRLVTFDFREGKAVAATKAGRQPYALAVDPGSKSVFVANIGIFDYSLIPGPREGSGGSPRGISKPAFGFPSRESEVGREFEGRRIPGLGSPYVPDAQSIWKYGLADLAKPKFVSAEKSGLLIHSPADGGKSVGGSAPNKLLVHGNRLFVSNANNDTVQVFSVKSMKPIKTIKMSPSPLVAKLRGVIPTGMAINRAGTRLYVSESGLNSVAVLDAKTYRILGRFPTGWFPVQITLTPDERRLVIATQKGLGRGPRGPLTPREAGDERQGLSDMPGMVQVATIPSGSDLAQKSKEVLLNNGILAQSPPAAKTKSISRVHGKKSPNIEYVVFITKENHTFDGIFGGLKGAKGHADYAEFGMEGWIREKGKDERLPIMPNHIRLAEQFAISDNFYMEPQASGDGHRWLVGVYPSLWTTRVFYSGWDFKRQNDAKGRLVSFGSYGSQIPEDYLENGSMWEHLARSGVTFRNYGEGYELPRADQNAMNNKTGIYYFINHPMPKVLYDNTCFEFPAYNTYIPDVARADWFIEDIEKNYRAKKKPLPKFINIAICNDHGDRARPNQGYPYTCSFMADNDLALGRIVEYLTKQPEWKKMAIFVTQDDSGADNDHIDRHRSFVLAISPFAKRGYVTREHTSIMSIIKSIYLLFGLPPNNMFDALATDLSDMFTDRPDYTPYKHVMTDPRVFKPEDTIDPLDPKFEKRRKEGPPVRMDDPNFVDWLRKQPVGGGGG
ncbi:MAG TPA: alkaline phosphatase family protein [Fimbriimonadaceae bacterium]|nr:alkaline phosphatase family protein [Fimbriimonadaceae bacterium]